jgi:hypothetical protein
MEGLAMIGRVGRMSEITHTAGINKVIQTVVTNALPALLTFRFYIFHNQGANRFNFGNPAKSSKNPSDVLSPPLSSWKPTGNMSGAKFHPLTDSLLRCPLWNHGIVMGSNLA